jgi:hypothetical protein
MVAIAGSFTSRLSYRVVTRRQLGPLRFGQLWSWSRSGRGLHRVAPATLQTRPRHSAGAMERASDRQGVPDVAGTIEQQI